MQEANEGERKYLDYRQRLSLESARLVQIRI